MRLGGGSFLGPFLFLLGLLGLAARPLLLLVCHDALPSRYSLANMLPMRSDSIIEFSAGAHRFVQRMNAMSSTMRSCQVVGLGQRRDEPLRCGLVGDDGVELLGHLGENPRGTRAPKPPTNAVFMCFSILRSW